MHIYKYMYIIHVIKTGIHTFKCSQTMVSSFTFMLEDLFLIYDQIFIHSFLYFTFYNNLESFYFSSF